MHIREDFDGCEGYDARSPDIRKFTLCLFLLGSSIFFLAGLLVEGHPFGLLGNSDDRYFARVFSAFSQSLLSGSVAIDPAIIGTEGFLVDGRVIAYWGVWPAALRMPFSLVLDLSLYDLTRLSMVTAFCLASAFKIIAAIDATGGLRAKNREFQAMVIVACLLSGLGIPLLARAGVWFEIALWSYAFSMAFIVCLQRFLFQPKRQWRYLILMAVAAGLSLHTRAPTGVCLLTALGFCCLYLLRPPLRRSLPKAWTGVFFATLPFVAGFLGMNFWRWGSPFKTLDMTAAITYETHRWAIENFGVYNPIRYADTLNYYFLPVWPYFDRLFSTDTAVNAITIFHALEPPYSSFFLTHGFWLLLAALGFLGLLREPPWRKALLLSLCFAFTISLVILLGFYFQAHRYRVEFAPLLYFLALAGVRYLRADPNPEASRVWPLLIAVQVPATLIVTITSRVEILGRQVPEFLEGYLIFLYRMANQ